MKGGEIIKYSTYLHIPYAATDIFVLKVDRWSSIPRDNQKTMEDSLQWFYDTMTKAEMQVTEEALSKARSRGTEFINLPQADLDKIFTFCEHTAAQTAKELDYKGLPGTKLFRRIREIIENS